jgi:hypothetical protein
MGVPVSFREIKGAAVIAEMDWMHDGLSPELSLGTHFFHEMVEADLLFIGLRRSDTECYLNMEWFEEKIAECCGLDDDTTQTAFTCLSCVPCTKSGGSILLYADPISQEVLLYQA